MRTTKAQVDAAFDVLCNVLGKSTKTWRTPPDSYTRAVIGAWYLDRNTVYGGYVVHEMANEGGGVRAPLGSMRMSGAEFVNAVRFALDVLEIARRDK
jgi:hypothetical protein